MLTKYDNELMDVIILFLYYNNPMEDITVKGLVIYKTKYGSSKQYAEWISEELVFDLVDVDHFNAELLDEYQMIIIGGYIHAEKFGLHDWIETHQKQLAGKSLYFFSVSGMAPLNKKLFEIYQAAVPEALRKQAQYFAFHGRMKYKDLDRIDKMTMNMGILMSRSTEQKERLHKGYDHVKKKAIFGLVNAVKKQIKAIG
jgi:menaquinone-dependent protoporphyrinogen IX oxidase